MKKMVLILGIMSILGLFVMTSLSVACGGCYGSGGSYAQVNLTDEQGQQLDTINNKYSKQLETIQESLNEKTRDYEDARANENTTVGTLNKIEPEIDNFDRQYGKILDQANSEADKILPDGYGPGFNCAYSGCSHQYHRGGNSHGDHMGQGHRRGMGGRHMNSYWRW